MRIPDPRPPDLILDIASSVVCVLISLGFIILLLSHFIMPLIHPLPPSSSNSEDFCNPFDAMV